MTNDQRETLYLLLIVLGLGITIGLLLGRRGSSRHDDHRQIEDKRRNGANMVFGNIVIGSNNGRENLLTFGYEDAGHND